MHWNLYWHCIANICIAITVVLALALVPNVLLTTCRTCNLALCIIFSNTVTFRRRGRGCSAGHGRSTWCSALSRKICEAGCGRNSDAESGAESCGSVHWTESGIVCGAGHGAGCCERPQ